MKRLLPLALLLLFLCIAGWFLDGTRTVTFKVDTPIQVTSTGEAYQNDKRVGFLKLGKDQQLIIPIVTPDISTNPVSTTFNVTFPTQTSASTTAHFISIQGLDEMTASWLSPQTLQVSVYGISPESYTQLVIEAPNGTFDPTLVNRLFNFLLSVSLIYWILAGVFLAAITLALCLWRTQSERWPNVSREITLPPPGVSLLDMAVLHHGSITATDIVALLYDLADRGYIQLIAHFEEEVSFLRTTKNDGLTSGERNFLLVLFPQENLHTQLSHIIRSLDRELFSAVVGQLYIDLYNSFTERNYFRENPRQLHIQYKTIAIFMQLAGIITVLMASFFFFHTVPGLIFIGLGIYTAGAIFFTFTYHFRPFSALGKQIVHECASFKAYLTNPKPIEFDGTAGLLFYQYLPIATALHCINQWQQRFSTSRMYIPDWYFNQEESLPVTETFVDETRKHAEFLAEAMVAVKDPNVD